MCEEIQQYFNFCNGDHFEIFWNTKFFNPQKLYLSKCVRPFLKKEREAGERIRWLTISEEEVPTQGTKKQETRLRSSTFSHPFFILLRINLENVAAAMLCLIGRNVCCHLNKIEFVAPLTDCLWDLHQLFQAVSSTDFGAYYGTTEHIC